MLCSKPITIFYIFVLILQLFEHIFMSLKTEINRPEDLRPVCFSICRQKDVKLFVPLSFGSHL